MFVTNSPKEPLANGNSQTSQVKKTVCQKRALEDSDTTGETLSKNKQKKRSRNPNKNFSPEQKRELKPMQLLKIFLLNAAKVTLTHFLSLAAKYIKCEQCGNPKVKNIAARVSIAGRILPKSGLRDTFKFQISN